MSARMRVCLGTNNGS
ncbi:hypothetical protein MTR67_003616 [Solanum verrucosum]|nr:hypothetical protein MTR67_003616 [Solanum verrucosum]